MMIHELETDRLKLRQWRSEDYPLFADMSADLRVMEYFPSPLTFDESYALASKIEGLIAQRGWGLWVVEIKGGDRFAGFVGLHEPLVALPFSPCVEVGWRLGYEFWGQGYATEAANAALKFAFETLGLTEVVSFTATQNLRSQAVMQRLKMHNTGENFDHPNVPIGHPLREHVLYRIGRSEWSSDRPLV
jgi:RimJ/RimL family protein N-acetyltransferase